MLPAGGNIYIRCIAERLGIVRGDSEKRINEDVTNMWMVPPSMRRYMNVYLGYDPDTEWLPPSDEEAQPTADSQISEIPQEMTQDLADSVISEAFTGDESEPGHGSFFEDVCIDSSGDSDASQGAAKRGRQDEQRPANIGLKRRRVERNTDSSDSE